MDDSTWRPSVFQVKVSSNTFAGYPVSGTLSYQFRYETITAAIAGKTAALLPSDFPMIPDRNTQQIPVLFKPKIEVRKTARDPSIDALLQNKTSFNTYAEIDFTNVISWGKYVTQEFWMHSKFWKDIRRWEHLETPNDYQKFYGGKTRSIGIHFQRVVMKVKDTIFQLIPNINFTLYSWDAAYINMTVQIQLAALLTSKPDKNRVPLALETADFYEEMARTIIAHFPKAEIRSGPLLPEIWNFVIYNPKGIPEFLEMGISMVQLFINNTAKELWASGGYKIQIPLKP